MKHTIHDNSLVEWKAVKHKIITQFSILTSLVIIQKLPFPCNRNITYKLTVVHLVKSFAAFYKSRVCIAQSTRAVTGPFLIPAPSRTRSRTLMPSFEASAYHVISSLHASQQNSYAFCPADVRISWRQSSPLQFKDPSSVWQTVQITDLFNL